MAMTSGHEGGTRWRAPMMMVAMALALLMCGAMPVRGQEAGLTLVRDGKPAATIVLAAEPLPSNQFAADELQSHIERMSGAKLPIASDADDVTGPRILIGQSRFTDAMKLDVPSGFSRKLDEEGFLIKTIGSDLVLIGNDGGPVSSRAPLGFKNTYKGSLFAVYELLERLGCRWYYPGEFGTVIPSASTVAIPATDDLVKPSFPVRGYWYGSAVPRRNDPAFKEAMNVWYVRNRFLPYGAVLASAGDGSIMAPFRKMERVERDGKQVRVNVLFDEHPEYFALTANGTRTPHYLCLSNPEVIRIATEYALAHFRENPDSWHFGYAPPDGVPTCECADCKAHNLNLMQKAPADPTVQDISEGFYRFLNQIAANVAEVYPEKWITSTAYSGRIRPPEATDLRDNITLHLAFLGYGQHHRLDFEGWQTQEKRNLLERWAAINPFMVERQYYPAFQFHCNIPLAMPRAHAYNIQAIKEMGMAGSEWEGRAAFKTDLLNYYVMGRMLWDVDTDVEAMLEEHYRLFYGAAAERVAAFEQAVEHMLTTAPVEFHEEERLPEIYPYAEVVKVTDAVGDIEAMVAEADPLTKQRVRFARLNVDHFRAWAEMRHLEMDLQFARAAEFAQKMVDIEAELDAMNPTFVDSYSANRDSRPTYGELGANASPHGKLKQYRAKQAMIDGTRGDLVAALPVQWEFRTDPEDQGLLAQWYSPQISGRDEWTQIDATLPWEAQGYEDEHLHGYDGYAWYRTTFDVPAEFKDRTIRLFIAGLNNQGWVWINNELAGYQPHHPFWMRWKYHHEIDITDYVKAGEMNEISIRVLNDYNFGGLFRRSFIYAPTADPTE